jgi:catechol 2,3-dioxygenase-like lactoylglutathione lyase family enzyme
MRTILCAAALILLSAPVAALGQPAVQASLLAPGLRVTDLDRSITFYRIALGLVPCRTLHHGPLTEVMLCADSASGRLTLILLRDEAPDKSPPVVLGDGLAKIVLRVPDVAAVAARMTAAGYPVDAVHQSGQGPAVLMLTDPDGYRHELVGSPPSAPAAPR